MDNKEITPDEFFNIIKKEQEEITDDYLNEYYTNVKKMIEKFKITKQWSSLRELVFFHDCIKRERKLIKLGFNKVVYKKTIEEFKTLAPNGIIFVDMKDYTRDIPDDIVEKIKLTNNIFTDYVILATDYTKEMTRKVEEKKRSKDPIIFGVFYENAGNDPRSRKIINERFYYVGDWVDEFCDLTLNKFIDTLTKNNSNKEYVHELSIPTNMDQLKKELMKMEDRNNLWVHRDDKTFLSKLKGLFKKGN